MIVVIDEVSKEEENRYRVHRAVVTFFLSIWLCVIHDCILKFLSSAVRFIFAIAGTSEDV